MLQFCNKKMLQSNLIRKFLSKKSDFYSVLTTYSYLLIQVAVAFFFFFFYGLSFLWLCFSVFKISRHIFLTILCHFLFSLLTLTPMYCLIFRKVFSLKITFILIFLYNNHRCKTCGYWVQTVFYFNSFNFHSYPMR